MVSEGHADPSEIGRSAIWEGEIAGCLHQNHLLRIRLDQEKLNPYYLSNYLNSSYGMEYMRRYAKTSSGLNTINSQVLTNMPIPYVPLQQQKEFEKLYKDCKGLLLENSNSASNLNRLYQSLLSQAFTGELTASWREQHIEELIQAAREIDIILKGKATVLIEVKTSESLELSNEETEREDLIDQLSLLQKTLLDIFLGNRQSYFTTNQLYEDHEEALQEKRLRASLDQVRRELRTLAALGLIREITLPVTDQPGRIDYATVYRYPQPDDNTMSEDLELLATRSL